MDVGPDHEVLITSLAARGLTATALHGLVEVQMDGDDSLDTVRDAIVDLGLPLLRMTSRLTSLDEVFVDRATTAAAEAATRRAERAS